MSFGFSAIQAALKDTKTNKSEDTGVDFSKQSLKLDKPEDAKNIISAIESCPSLNYLNLQGNTLGVEAAEAIAKALEGRPEFKRALWADMFTGRMKTEIPLALTSLGNGMIAAGARLRVLDLSDNAFGPIGVRGLAKLLQSEVCSQLEELYLNNNGLGIEGGTLLSKAILSCATKPRLKVFVAGRNRLENEGAKQLATVFHHLGTLEVIAMPQNGIYHVGISALSKAFENNPQLRSLNLNDNTIGPKGAEAFASALPKLKQLLDINFGDCLLKSKGALTLAKGFKQNNVQLESLDLSFNEMNSASCSEVLPCARRVLLQGNRLNAALRSELTKAGLLSDGSDNDDEEENESSDEEEGSESEEDANDSDQDSKNISVVSGNNISGLSGVNSATNDDSKLSASVIFDVSGDDHSDPTSRFMTQPTVNNLIKLGSKAAEMIDTRLLMTSDPITLISSYVEVIMKVSSLSLSYPPAVAISRELYANVARHAANAHAVQWVLANSMLASLGLIKSEDKKFKIKWDLEGCFRCLSEVIDEDFFPLNLKETLKFFINSKKEPNSPFIKYKNLLS